MTDLKTKYGHFEVFVLPSGLTNVLAVFTDIMNKMFSNKLDDFFSAYLNDILVYSKTFLEIYHI